MQVTLILEGIKFQKAKSKKQKDGQNFKNPAA
jgi:hypothetical protein